MPTAKVSPIKILSDLGVDATKLNDDKGYLQALIRVTNELTNTNPSDQRIPLLQREIKRVRAIRIASPKAQASPKVKATAQPQTPKAPRVSTEKVVKKAADVKQRAIVKPQPQVKVDPKKVVPPDNVSKENAENIKANTQRQQKSANFDSNVLAPSLKKISDNFGDILGGFKDQRKADAKAAQVQARKDDREAKKKREATLEEDDESKKDLDGVKKQTEDVKKKAGGIFSTISNFFKNILLGGAVVGLLKIIKNPKILLNPFISGINGLIGLVNFVVKVVVDGISMPFKALFKGLNFGINFVIKAFNAVVGKLPFIGDKVKLPEIKLPTDWGAPEIPKIAKFGAKDGPKEELKVQKSQEGGEIESVEEIQQIQMGGKRTEESIRSAENLRQGKDKPYGSVQQQEKGGKTVSAQDISIKQGGKVTPTSGIRITGMGPDTQLVAAQPGEVMFSKAAVDHYGSERLLAMNKKGGGDNKPRYGSTSDIMPMFWGGKVKKKRPGPGEPGWMENFNKLPEWYEKRIKQKPNPENWKLVKEHDLEVEDLGGTGFDQRMVTVSNPAIQNKKGEKQRVTLSINVPKDKLNTEEYVNRLFNERDFRHILNKPKREGLGRVLGGLGDFITGGKTDFDNRDIYKSAKQDKQDTLKGKGPLGGMPDLKGVKSTKSTKKPTPKPPKKTPQKKDEKKGGGWKRWVGGAADALTGGVFDFDKRGNTKLQDFQQRVAGGVADAATFNAFDFDKKNKPQVDAPGPSPKKAGGITILGSKAPVQPANGSNATAKTEDLPLFFPSSDPLNPELNAIKSIYNIIGG